MRIVPILASAVLLGAASSPPSPAQNFVSTEAACTVAEVAANANLVHVYCNFGGGIANLGTDDMFVVRYFAVALNDPLAPHLVTIGSTSQLTGRQIAVLFNPDASANPPGCLAADCRRALALKGFGGGVYQPG